MVRSAKGYQQETFLAVLDGRFLPIDEMSFSISQDSQDIYAGGGSRSSMRVVTESIMRGKFRTRREPSVKDWPTELRIYGSDEEYIIWNIHVQTSAEVGQNSYSISFEGTKWSCSTR